jgi:hypothetical protein
MFEHAKVLSFFAIPYMLRFLYKRFICQALLSALLLLIVDGAVAQEIPPTRLKLIMENLVGTNWNLEAIKSSRGSFDEQSNVAAAAEQLWQGNIPRTDVRLQQIEMTLQSAGGQEAESTIVLDLNKEKPLLRHSRSRLKGYAGGVLFNKKRPQPEQFYLLGDSGSDLFIFMPPWTPPNDFYTALCPRVLSSSAVGQFTLSPTVLHPGTMKISVAGRIKALLFSGSSLGKIEARFENSEAIPPALESHDIARGINPIVDLVYRPAARFEPPRLAPGETRHDYFSLLIAMQLPGGAQRTIREGFDFWVVPAEFPAMEVMVPVSTITQTKFAGSIPRIVRETVGSYALKTQFQAGSCVVIIAERRAPEKLYHEKAREDVTGVADPQ